jgi:hypothetical protein
MKDVVSISGDLPLERLEGAVVGEIHLIPRNLDKGIEVGKMA